MPPYVRSPVVKQSVGTPAPRTLVVVLTGDVDRRVETELDQYLKEFDETEAVDATVDLTHVTYFGGSGVAFLTQLGRAAAARGGRVSLVQPDETLVRLLRIVAMLTFFEIEPR